MTKNIILLNAIPGTGKDTIANRFCEINEQYIKLEFKQPLYEEAAKLVGMSVERVKLMATKEGVKDRPCTFDVDLRPAGGKFKMIMSPRQLLIFTSEHVIKPLMGDKYFGERLVESINNKKSHIISDCGFSSEVAAVLQGVTRATNVILAKFTRNGVKEFPKGDSRNWVDPKDVYNQLTKNKTRKLIEIEFTNDSTVEDACATLLSLVEKATTKPSKGRGNDKKA